MSKTKKKPARKEPKQNKPNIDGGNFIIVNDSGNVVTYEETIDAAKGYAERYVNDKDEYEDVVYIFEAKPIYKVESSKATITKL